MRLRTARKIFKAVGTPRQSAYSDAQFEAAGVRMRKTRTPGYGQAYWDAVTASMTAVERCFLDRRAGRRISR